MFPTPMAPFKTHLSNLLKSRVSFKNRHSKTYCDYYFYPFLLLFYFFLSPHCPLSASSSSLLSRVDVTACALHV